MFENDAIQKILEGFPRHPEQLNRPFGSDAEVVRIGGETWALTTDDFSADEDLFVTDTWQDLGWILTVATLSDLLAVGADPRFFLHALSLPREAPQEMLTGLAHGARAALDQAGAFLLGGDLGTANPWRFCGTALGPVAGRPLTRVLPEQPLGLWVTGTLGDAAAAALIDAPTPKFELRLAESRRFRSHAAACTDTSGGFFRSLWDLLTVSPPTRMEIDRARLPIDPGVQPVLSARGVPPEAALLAGAGEYELLFAAPVDTPARITDGCTCVGRATPATTSEVRMGHAVMHGPPPEPRAVADADAHAAQVMALATEMFA